METENWSKSLGAEYASDEPEFMCELGRAMAEWGNVEHALSSVFAVAIQSKDPFLARASFHSIVGFSDRLRAVEAIIAMQSKRNPTVFWEEVHLEWKRIDDVLSKTSRKRNRLAHMHVWQGPKMGTFGAQNITGLADLPLDPVARKKEVVTIALMRDYRRSFCSAADRVYKFQERLTNAD